MNEKTAQKTSLEIIRFINVSPARVYEAWTDSAQLREWFGPENVRTRNLTADVRVDGKYRWDLTSPEGEDMSAFGEYKELVQGKKIVFTWQWHDDEAWENRSSVVTIELFERRGGTELRFRHEQLPSEESRDRHNEGWNSLLDGLEQFISR
ncbi:MAG TPA: SRPBCC domain-containing protein [Candidatus Babeliales bacterium]|nr:SRPBCC domain-containing protein [Candidatus Babeliales bacterium]